jgi:hypothetical protein
MRRVGGPGGEGDRDRREGRMGGKVLVIGGRAAWERGAGDPREGSTEREALVVPRARLLHRSPVCAHSPLLAQA